ncbi:Alpha/Beta hydrolase protein [Crepidotus variabilis]|uniref:Alpha/Beta hydrolase protein n=1 Tax=Crepidotus variabilis TaxID=179855 RepID=A0A9P6EFV0_9AGAR|nr:Alpha/Beta hydrolase protein [Crepidotus variabilis]
MSCPRCQEGTILEGEPTGSVLPDFHGAYFSPAPPASEGVDIEVNKKRAVLLFTCAFGLPLKNNKLMADEYAKRLGCDVWVPDYFLGRPLLPVDAMIVPDRAGVPITWWKWITFIITQGIPNLGNIINTTNSKADSRLEGFINLVKEKKGYEKIGTVGYCFGGATCVRFGSKPAFVDSVVVSHPGPFTIQDVRRIQVPVAFVCAEEDVFFADKLRDQAEAELASRKGKDNFVDYEIMVYKGTAHGFANRPNLTLPEIKEAYEGALDQTTAWFKKTLW